MQIDIGIDDKDRKKIAAGLSRLLADSYGLYLQTHNFHPFARPPGAGHLHRVRAAHVVERDDRRAGGRE